MSFNPDKTEIMIFSNVEYPELLFSLNERTIPVVTSHKHLGVTFSADAKWNDHINNIATSISKHLNVLRKLKYRLNRQNLEKLYITFIRPIFEYASELWDNCGIGNIDKLEKLQLEAARIVTGLPIFTKSEKIYSELGWETLQERRKRRKLQMFYSILNGNAPNYLCRLIPPTLQSTTIYPLRNGDDIIVPFCRLSVTTESFIPSTIRQWNSLDLAIRNLNSVSKFKSETKRNSKNLPIPIYYSYGPRKLNIILTQLRCSASFLNDDLYRVNIVSDPSCSCGHRREDPYHFFFQCTKYINLRQILFNKLDWLPNDLHLDVNLITHGSMLLTRQENECIFQSVFEYIKKSERFLVI